MAPTLPRPTFDTAPPPPSDDSHHGTTIVLSSSSDFDESDRDSIVNLVSSSSDSIPGPIALTSSDSSDGDHDRAASSGWRRGQPINRAWMFRDEVKILTALAAGRRDAGELPTSSALLEVLLREGGLHRENPTAVDVARKVGSLKSTFKRVIAAGGPKAGLRSKRLFHLSAEVWPELLHPHPEPSSSSSTSTSHSH
ncbi:hypothetical protein ACP4OV_016698 [Aristida adscensionis]